MLSYFENRVLLKPALGVWSVLHASLLVIDRPDKTESAIFFSLVFFLFPRAITFQNLFA